MPPRLALVSGLALLAACGSSPQERTDPAAAPSTVASVVSQGRLSGFLPAPPEWTRGEISGGMVDAPDPPRSSSGTTYLRGPARINLEIVDTAGRPEYIESTREIAGSAFDSQSSNGYVRGATVGGFPAIESWNHVDALGEITVLLANRFVVHASGVGLDDVDALRAFVMLVDLESIAALEPR